MAGISHSMTIPYHDTIPIISQGMGAAHAIGSTAASLAGAIAGALAGSAPPLVEAPTMPSPSFSTPSSRSFSGAFSGSIAFPSPPTMSSLSTILPLDIEGAPSRIIDIPLVEFPDAPSALSAEPPQPDATLPVSIPSAPSIVMPSAPSLSGVTTPSIPSIDLGEFTSVLGDAPTAPSPAFSFSETEYTSTLLSDIRALYDVWVNGAATGIDQDVEEAIWNRGRDREAANFSASQDQVYRDFAARGFALPAGTVVSEVAKAREAMRNAASTLNRDVMIKQAELEQSNRRFALEQAWQVESGLITYTSQMAQRSFEAAKYLVEAAIEVYKAQVTEYNAEVEAFRVRAQVYETRLRGEIAKLDIYKAEIEGQKLITDLNDQSVRVYTAQLQAVNTMVQVFETEVRAASVQADINRSIIEQFRARVQAYAEQVRAKASEYEGYSTLIKAEVSKYEAPKVAADVLRAETEGYAAKMRALVDAKNAEIKVREFPIEIFKAQIQAFQGQVQGVAEQLRAAVSVYETQARAFAEEVRASGYEVEGAVALLNAQTKIAEATGQLSVESQKANTSAFVENARMKVEGARGAAAVMAQLAAGAMAGLSLSASAQSATGGHVNLNMNDAGGESTSTVTSDITTHKGD